MFILQILVIFALWLGFSVLLLRVLGGFGLRVKSTAFLIIPLLVFSLGFSLRLTTNEQLVDLGFFLTDFSSLFISVLFTAFLFLGQLKYWKK